MGDKILAIGSRFSSGSLQFDGVDSLLTFGPDANKATLALAGNFEAQTLVITADPDAPNQNTIIQVEELQTAPILNVIVGSTADDWLIGSTGEDSIVGGDGNDTLYGEDSDDQLQGDPGMDRLSGGLGNDVIVGGQGDDRIIGGGGFDSLTGGDGRDRFVFQNPYQMADVILDFDADQDLFVLHGSTFGLDSSQPLLQTQFVVGTQASQPKNQVIYNDVNGELFFDADGSGGQGPILLAQLAPMLELSHHNFRVMDY